MNKRKSRIYEYTTQDYGKGFIIAKNQKSAVKKTLGINRKDMSVSYYDLAYKGKNKYGL